MFPSLGILQHYARFESHTIVMLEKLFGARSFGGFINHRAHHHAIFIASLGGLGLPPVVQIVAPAFLGCWALIALTFITCF
jgi:hypothetical protein